MAVSVRLLEQKLLPRGARSIAAFSETAAKAADSPPPVTAQGSSVPFKIVRLSACTWLSRIEILWTTGRSLESYMVLVSKVLPLLSRKCSSFPKIFPWLLRRINCYPLNSAFLSKFALSF
jgi:hypothetical protein